MGPFPWRRAAAPESRQSIVLAFAQLQLRTCTAACDLWKTESQCLLPLPGPASRIASWLSLVVDAGAGRGNLLDARQRSASAQMLDSSFFCQLQSCCFALYPSGSQVAGEFFFLCPLPAGTERQRLSPLFTEQLCIAAFQYLVSCRRFRINSPNNITSEAGQQQSEVPAAEEQEAEEEPEALSPQESSEEPESEEEELSRDEAVEDDQAQREEQAEEPSAQEEQVHPPGIERVVWVLLCGVLCSARRHWGHSMRQSLVTIQAAAASSAAARGQGGQLAWASTSDCASYRQ